MPPHPPPCRIGEIRIGNTCYPSPDLHINPLGANFNFTVDNVHLDAVPGIKDMAGGGDNISVDDDGINAKITITGVPRGTAESLLKGLKPDDPDAKLP